jgi:hypothetical protein
MVLHYHERRCRGRKVDASPGQTRLGCWDFGVDYCHHLPAGLVQAMRRGREALGELFLQGMLAGRAPGTKSTARSS